MIAIFCGEFGGGYYGCRYRWSLVGWGLVAGYQLDLRNCEYREGCGACC